MRNLADMFVRVVQYIISIYTICVFMYRTELDRIVAAVVITQAAVEAHHRYV
jgi:hypothetical protein